MKVIILSPRELWIQALRSGKYKQGYYSLANRGKFCCLGVACEVYQEHVGGLETKNINHIKHYDNNSKVLPMSVRTWLGITRDLHSILTVRNDKLRETFEQIANFLENYESY